MICETTANPSDSALIDEGYERALEMLHACRTPEGFLASTNNKTNYRRVWSRDGGITSIASVRSGNADLIETAKCTLRSLAGRQGPHGEIPSNFSPDSGRISYGGTAGRVDADLWFVIASAEVGHTTKDEGLLAELWPALQRVEFLLGCWEFNSRGLIYVPPTGDWADEYLHHGYVLYDQLLYLQAQRSFSWIEETLHGSENHERIERIDRLKSLIRANYWIDAPGRVPEFAYHPVIYRKCRAARESRKSRYWLPFFSPHGYGYRFDAFANVLTTLVGVSNAQQDATLDAYLDEILDWNSPLLPAFAPVITPHDGDWEELQVTFSNSFKNRPYEFQNGGIWPMIMGFLVARLAKLGQKQHAHKALEALHWANSLPADGKDWSFPEYLHGQTLKPGSTHDLAWSAAAAIIGHHALQGDPPFMSESQQRHK